MAALRRFWKRILFSDCWLDDQSKPKPTNDNARDSFTSILGPFEAYVITIQSILIWEKPFVSSVAFLFFNAVFWLVVNSQCRFYFILALVAIVIYLYRTWVNQIWPEIRVPIPAGEDTEEWTPVNPQVLSVPEIDQYLTQMSEISKEWFTWFTELRRDQPGKFCALITSLLMGVALVSHCISGVTLAYIIMTGVLLGPGFFVHIYPQLFNLLSSSLSSSHVAESHATVSKKETASVLQSDADDLDDFLPESNHETLATLAHALDSQDATIKNEDALILQDLGMDDDILPNDNDDDLSLKTSSSEPSSEGESNNDGEGESNNDGEGDGLVSTGGNSSEDGKIFPVRSQRFARELAMKFVSSHFKYDSDDSEDDIVTKGLNFDVDDHDTPLAPTLENQQSDHDNNNVVDSMPPVASTSDDKLETIGPSLEGEGRPCLEDFHPNVAQSEVDSVVSSPSFGDQPSDDTTRRPISRQNSTPSVVDLSDYEVVSESELS